MLRKSITAAVITAFEMLIALDQWDGILKFMTAAVVFWWMNLLLLIGMEGGNYADHKDGQRN